MVRIAIGLVGLVMLASCASTPQISPAARSDLSPTGTLRVGINYGNEILARRVPESGELRGVHVDLAGELGRQAGVPVELVGYAAAGKMVDGLTAGVLDVAFLAADPARASEISYTASYLEIEATYLVPADSSLRNVADVDREGVRIAVPAKSAYDLLLSRSLKRAQLMRASSTPAAFDLFVAAKLEAVVGLRPRLVVEAEKLPGSRVLDGHIETIQQAIGSPKGRDAGARYLREFIESAKASGLVARVIENNGVRGVSITPKARVP